MMMNESQIIGQVQPEEDNNNNINDIATYEQHLHSVMYQLLHTAVGALGDPRALYFEDGFEYIGSEDRGGMFIIEQE